MNAVELFCGMGMSALGVHGTPGVRLLGAVDSHRPAVEAFNSQGGLLPPVAEHAKVGEVEWNFDVDLMAGGPVCKAFSPGARLFGTRGKADARNTFPAFISELEAYLPGYAMIENSFGLGKFAGYLAELVAKITSLGYTVDTGEIQCYDFGVPQDRRRMVFLCSRKRPWKIRLPKKRLAGPETVGDVMYDPPAGDPWPLVRPLTAKGRSYYLRDPRHVAKHRPLTMDRPASAVVANYHKGVPYGVVEIDGALYNCMPRLAARLQGLPDEYDLAVLSKTEALRAIGNGFPWQVVCHLMKGLP